MIFCIGFVMVVIFGIWHIRTEGSVSGLFCCVGWLLMLVSILNHAWKHLL